MAKLDRARWPSLAAAWDGYGHQIVFDDLFDAKVGQHGYVALAWRLDAETVEYADLASPDGGRTWEFQNDSCGTLTIAEWRRAKVVPECDWLDV